MIEIYIPEFSPMYTLIWEFIVSVLKAGPLDASARLRPWVVRDIKAYTIITPRIGVFQTVSGETYWHHVCHPGRFYKRLKEGQIKRDDPWLELNWVMAHFNRVADFSFGCKHSSCKYKLTKNEIVLINMATLGMKL